MIKYFFDFLFEMTEDTHLEIKTLKARLCVENFSFQLLLEGKQKRETFFLSYFFLLNIRHPQFLEAFTKTNSFLIHPSDKNWMLLQC